MQREWLQGPRCPLSHRGTAREPSRSTRLAHIHLASGGWGKYLFRLGPRPNTNYI